MTSFDISPELRGILEGLRAFIDAEVITRHRKAEKLLSDPRLTYHPDGRYSDGVLDLIREVRMTSATAGYYTMFVPESIGGAGLGSEALFRVWEDIFHRYGPSYWLAGEAIAHWARGPSHVLAQATDWVRERVLPPLLSGEASMCFGMSEPDAGSDALGMKTMAVADGDEWVISGGKIWTSNGANAEYAVIFAVTEGPTPTRSRPGISAFLVPTATPGFKADANIRMFNHIGGGEATLYLDDVRVGKDYLLGDLNHGFAIAMTGVSAGRMYNSAKSVGLARWAIEMAVEYAQSRQAFGKLIAVNQGVTFPLAESAMEVHAAHTASLHCAWLLDNGQKALKELSMAKAFATESAVRAIDRSIQVHGAIGFTNELGLISAWESARKVCVADGTSEILRRSIVKHLLAGDLEL